MKDDHLSMNLNFPVEKILNDRRQPCLVLIRATMYLPVSGFDPRSSVFLGECVTPYVTVMVKYGLQDIGICS